MDLSIKELLPNSQRYGLFDAEELNLINKYNARGLILSEEANEIAKIVLHHDNVIENILEMVLSDVPDVCILPSETFDMTDALRWRDTLTNYVKTVKQKVKNLKKYRTVVAVLALELGGVGHYAAMVVRDRMVTVFDSMQSVPRGGFYTQDFIILVGFICDQLKIADDIVVEPAIQHPLLSLEFTGGFSENKPAELKYSRRMPSQVQEIISHQHIDSQNHFCYMWAVWYVDLVLHGKTLTGVLPARSIGDEDAITPELVQEIHAEFIPIIVIKKYIWCILHRDPIRQVVQELLNEIEHTFFENHFLTIWWNPRFNRPLFHRYRIRFRMDQNASCFDNATPTDHGARDRYGTEFVREDL